MHLHTLTYTSAHHTYRGQVSHKNKIKVQVHRADTTNNPLLDGYNYYIGRLGASKGLTICTTFCTLILFLC